MAYTRDDVTRLMFEVGELRAKRQALLMHPPVMAVPYIGTDKEGAAAASKAAEAEAAAAQEMARLEREFPPVEWEVGTFGLRLRLCDPISGEIETVCHPKTKKQEEIFMTAKQVEDLLMSWRKPVLEKRNADAAAAKAAADKAFAEMQPQPPVPVAAQGGQSFANVPR